MTSLRVMEYEHALWDIDDWRWFDVAADYKGQVVLLDTHETVRYTKAERRELEKKRALCLRQGLPYLFIKPKASMEMAADIEAFLLTLMEVSDD